MSRILEALHRAGVRHFPDVKAFCEGPPFNLRVAERGNLYALRYNRGESDFRSPVVRQARGIVLEKETNRIVSWAFNKFYEYGEDAPSYRERPNLRQSVADPKARYERKYDGVLIKVVRRPGGELLVSSNGRICASEAPVVVAKSGKRSCTLALAANFYEAFAQAGGLELPYDDDICYAFELMHPDVPTVVPSESISLVHLMSRRLCDDFDEVPFDDRFSVSGVVCPPEIVSFRSFGACRNAARMLPWDEEGYVVVDGYGNRIKVKSEAYMAMQRLIVGDSENAANDALAVALTLHHAKARLPLQVAEFVTSWRRRAQSFAETCVERAQLPLATRSRRGQSARSAQSRIETALGGRVPQGARAVIAGAFKQQEARLAEQEVHSSSILSALRRSRLTLDEICSAIDVSMTDRKSVV